MYAELYSTLVGNKLLALMVVSMMVAAISDVPHPLQLDEIALAVDSMESWGHTQLKNSRCMKCAQDQNNVIT